MGDCIVETIPAVTAMLTVSTANKSDSIKYNLYLDQQSAADNVVLWGHPAWLNTNAKSIQITAATEWVFHNRIWMAIDRTTVAEVVGSVRGVIPSSKLASYGNFSYDLDIETMYDNLDEKKSTTSNETESVCREDAFNDSSCSSRESEFSVNKGTGRFLPSDWPSFSSVRDLLKQMKFESKMKNYGRPQSVIIDKWLLKWKAFLKSVMLAVGEDDPWTDTLLKVCCRFLTTARDNQSLMLLMETEMPLINNYRQLYTDPIALVELLSLPQPYLEENHQDLVTSQTDILWLRLSSGNVRELWPKNTLKEISKRAHPFVGFSDASVGATNFLRRRRTKRATNVCDEVQIPEDEVKHLLGSLINVMDGLNYEMGALKTSGNKFSTTEDTVLKNVLPETHEEWLFPHDKNIADSTVNIRKTQTKIKIPEQIFCQGTSTMSVQPNNLSASLSNLSVPSTNLSMQLSNLPVPSTNLSMQLSNLPVPSTNLSVPPSNLPANLSVPPTTFPRLPMNLSVPPSNLPVPPSNLPVPPINLHVLPTNLSMNLPKLALAKSNLTVPPAKSTAIFQSSNFTSGTVPSSHLPVYYLPVSHYVNREGKYYNRFRRKLPQNILNNSDMAPKASEQPFILPNIPMHSSFPSEHCMIIRNCNQLPISSPFYTAASLQNQRQISCHGNFQQSMIMPMHIQAPQTQRPLKLEKNNSIPNEYFFKEINKNRILQNISNTIPNAKSRKELITGNSFPLFYQSMESVIQPVTKQNSGMNSSSTLNIKYSMHRKLLNKYFAEGQSTYPTTKDSKDLPIVSALNISTANPLCQHEGPMTKKLEFESAKRPDSLQSNNENKIKTLNKNKGFLGEFKNEQSSKVQCRYFTQKWFSENQNIYKTKYCNAISKNALWIITHTRGRCKGKEQRHTKQIFRKQKLLSTLLIYKYKNRHLSHNLQKSNALKEHTRMHKNSEINTKQNLFDDSFGACHLNKEDKYSQPITVEYLKEVEDHLLCDECDRDIILNSGCEKIDGLTHFKIAVLEILRRSTLMLKAKNS